jgi:hypothetical protein
MGMGIVLPWIWESKPVPIPEHPCKQKHMVLLIPESHLIKLCKLMYYDWMEEIRLYVAFRGPVIQTIKRPKPN